MARAAKPDPSFDASNAFAFSRVASSPFARDNGERASVVLWVAADSPLPPGKLSRAKLLALPLESILGFSGSASIEAKERAEVDWSTCWSRLAESAEHGELDLALVEQEPIHAWPEEAVDAWAAWHNDAIRQGLSGVQTADLWAFAQAQGRMLRQSVVRSKARSVDALASLAEGFEPGSPLAALETPSWPNGKEVTLDVFDTCLFRRVLRPVDVFHLLAALHPSLAGALNFPAARLAAETNARSMALAEGRGEDVTLEEIYTGLVAELGISEGDAAQWYAVEMILEAKLLYGHEGLAAQSVDAAVVAYVSEMYLPDAVLAQWLEAAGFASRPVYTSGATGKSKGTGNLFRHVATSLPFEPSALLHLGDNADSDGTQPLNAGWAAEVTSSKARPTCWADHSATPDETLSVWDSLLWGLAREGVNRRDPHSRAGYLWHTGWQIAGPLALDWLVALWHRTAAAQTEMMFFLGRDGWWLERAWQRLQEVWGGGTCGRYLYASRALLNRAAMTDLSSRDWDFILHASPMLSAHQILARMEIVADGEIASRAAKLGLPSLDEPLADDRGEWLNVAHRDALYHLIVQQGEAMHAARQAHRERVLDYLDASGALAGNVAFVDLGWHGSSFDALARIRDSVDAPRSAEGFLWASWRTAQAASSGLPWTSHFCHRGGDSKRAAMLQLHVAALEMLFGAPHPTVLGLTGVAGGDRRPLFADEPELERNQAFRDAVWEGAEAFLDEALAVVTRPISGGNGAYVEAALSRWLTRPAPAEAENWSTLIHREGWGNAAAALPFFPESLAAAPWKAGWLARNGRL